MDSDFEMNSVHSMDSRESFKDIESDHTEQMEYDDDVYEGDDPNEFTENSKQTQLFVTKRLMKRGIPLYILPLRTSRNKAQKYNLNFIGWNKAQINAKQVIVMIEDIIEMDEGYKNSNIKDWEIWIKKTKYNKNKHKYYASSKTVNRKIMDGDVFRYIKPSDLDECIISIEVVHPTKTKENLLKGKKQTNSATKVSNNSSYLSGRAGKSALEKNRNMTVLKTKWLDGFVLFIKSQPTLKDVAEYIDNNHQILWSVTQTAVLKQPGKYSYDDAIQTLRARMKPAGDIKMKEHKKERNKFRVKKKDIQQLNIIKRGIKENDLELIESDLESTASLSRNSAMSHFNEYDANRIIQQEIQIKTLEDKIDSMQHQLYQLNEFVDKLASNQTVIYVCVSAEVQSNNHLETLHKLNGNFETIVLDESMINRLKQRDTYKQRSSLNNMNILPLKTKPTITVNQSIPKPPKPPKPVEDDSPSASDDEAMKVYQNNCSIKSENISKVKCELYNGAWVCRSSKCYEEGSVNLSFAMKCIYCGAPNPRQIVDISDEFAYERSMEDMKTISKISLFQSRSIKPEKMPNLSNDYE